MPKCRMISVVGKPECVSTEVDSRTAKALSKNTCGLCQVCDVDPHCERNQAAPCRKQH